MSGDEAAGPLPSYISENAFQLAILAAELLFHAFALGVALTGTFEPLASFRLESVVLVLLSGGSAAAGFFPRRAGVYRLLLIIRFGLLFALFRCLAGAFTAVPLLLASGLAVEAFAWDGFAAAIALDSIFVAGFTIDLATVQPPPCRFPYALAVAAFPCAIAAIVAIAARAVRYRERLAGKIDELERVEETVRALMNANIAFQIYANAIESESIAKERNRITLELHDTVGYALTNVIVMMNAAGVLLKKNPAELEGLFEKVGKQAEEALAGTRQTLHLLHDIQGTEQIGLPSVARLVSNFGSATQVDAEVSFGNLPASLGRNLDTVIFRIVQEALTNAFRHGRASKIRVSMWCTDNEILLTIHDNGKGIESEGQVVEGLGFSGMRERLAVFGGSTLFRNVADGFELRAMIPYHVRIIEE
jgi:signal transduction histidine kinase